MKELIHYFKECREINGKTKTRFSKYTKIRVDLNVECMREMVDNMRIRWYGHVKRMDEKILFIRMEERRKK